MTAAARHRRDDDRERVLAAFAAMSPHEAATVLGLDIAPRTSPGARVVRVSCVWHSERRPSCDVINKRGVILARCRSCNGGGDVFGIVAMKEGLDVRANFRRVLERAAELVGVDVTHADAQPLSPLDLARAETRAAKREVQRVRDASEKAMCAAREEHALTVAEMVARIGMLESVVAWLSDAVRLSGSELRGTLAAAVFEIERQRERFNHILSAAAPMFVATLPEGMDPDAFVREQGPDALTTLIRCAKPLDAVTVERARLLLPPLRQACERGTRADVRAAVARLEEALT